MSFKPGYYRICTDKPFINTRYIYPQKQRDVSNIISNVESDLNIEYILIFGSSTSNRCHQRSDIDVYIKCKENKRPRIYSPNNIESSVDLWTNFDLEDAIDFYNEIIKEGVLVYDNRDITRHG